MANFREHNRYTGGKIATNRKAKTFLILRQSLNLQPDQSDIFITVTQELLQRPDLIASQVYGLPELWWVIYEFNGIRDPLFSLTIGQILRVPELTRVLNTINSLVS